jgi:Ankyrin repeats (many copies)
LTGANHTLRSASGLSGYTTPRRLVVETKHRPERWFLCPGNPLHYIALWCLHAIVELLVIEHSQSVHSWATADKLTPLYLASRRGYVGVVRILLTEAHRGFDSPGQTRVDTIGSGVAMETRASRSYASQARCGCGNLGRRARFWHGVGLYDMGQLAPIQVSCGDTGASVVHARSRGLLGAAIRSI